MLKPRALRAGDRIALVAPASPFEREEFDAGVREVRALGFEPVFDETIFDRRGYVAGEASVRAAQLAHAWHDSSIAGVIAVRGGYGSVQLLPLLDGEEARRARKVFIGYSDVTTILLFLASTCGVVSFHGPMLAGKLGLGPDGYDRQSFLRCVTRAEPAGEMAPAGLETLNRGEFAGPLFGGTMTQVLASLGTPFAFDPPPGYVLFVEEVGERPYRLDRMITQMRYSGLLTRAGAVVFGELPQCDEPAGNLTARGVVADLMSDFNGPVLFGFPSGHTAGPALTIPLGVRTRVVADARPRLIVEEAAVD